MAAHLVIVTEEGAFQQPLEDGELVLGSADGCGLVIPGAAERHAALLVTPDGVSLRQLEGPVVVNGAPQQQCDLRPGDELRIGAARLHLSRDPTETEVRVSKDATRPEYEKLSTADPANAARFQLRFELLMDMARTVGSNVGYRAALDRLMDVVHTSLAPERAVLALAGDGDGRLRLEAARHAKQEDPWRDLQVSGTILQRVISTGDAFITADAVRAEETRHIQSVARQQIRSAMCVPFRWRGQVGGALYVDHRGSANYFSEGDLDFLIVLSHLATVALQNVSDYESIRDEVRRLRDAAGGEHEIVGQAEPIKRLRELMARVGPSDQPVLILGERGTGKELVARQVHGFSGRDPFVAVNCAAIPDSLIEGALFGHEKGAFTGADRRHRGYFEQAQGGTLFLDEIGDLKPPAQAAILRALQEGEVRRVGSLSPVTVDVRVISATNRALGAAAGGDEFRADLYDRLNVLQLEVPALRERPEDIPLLASHFVSGRVRKISARALTQLRAYSWPGNVRELKNVVERAIVMGDGQTIWPEDLPKPVRDGVPGHYHLVTLEAMEKDHVIRVLRHTGGNVSRAAEILGIRRITIYKKLKKYGLEAADFKGQG